MQPNNAVCNVKGAGFSTQETQTARTLSFSLFFFPFLSLSLTHYLSHITTHKVDTYIGRD